MSENAYLTKEGREKLQAELEDLKKVKRKEVAERIQEAKELGDLSENAEYTDAKNEQAFIEGRILEVDHILKTAEVVVSGGSIDTVRVGSRITIRSGSEKEMQLSIVGSSETDPHKGLVSNESPLGKAFLGRHVGDTVEIKAPGGATTYTIISIA